MNERSTTVSVLGAALLLVCSCGDSLDVHNTGPRGSVGGIVVDAVTRAPLEGVSVSVLAGGEVKDTVTTDADGRFGVNDVRAGDVLVTLTPPEGAAYQGAWVHDHLENDAGQFPANNTLTLGPLGLVPTSGDFTLRVLDSTGKPVSQYPVTLDHFVEYVDFKSGVAQNRGEVVMQGTTGTDGRVTFSGFPDYYSLGYGISDTVVVFLEPLVNGSVFDYPGGAQTLSIRSLTDPTPDVVLDPAFAATLQVRASTIDQLVSGLPGNSHATVIDINDAVHIKFNLPVRNDATITVTTETGAPLPAAPALSMSDDNIAVSFSSNPLLPGSEYNIQIHAVAAVSGIEISGDFAASFFTRPINDAVTVANITRPAADVVDIEFSEPIGIGAGNAAYMTDYGNCVLFFNYDIDGAGAGTIGNYPGERGYPNCWGGQNQYIYSTEPDPEGLPYLSGYTKYWRVLVPASAPTGTRMDLVFSRVTSATYIVERADGRAVPDFAATTSIPIP